VAGYPGQRHFVLVVMESGVVERAGDAAQLQDQRVRRVLAI